MAVYFECVTLCGASRAELFEKSLSIDAHAGSMADSQEKAVAGVTSGTIGLGEQVTWRAKHFGIPFRMTSRISDLDAPHTFTDQQERGPFKSFHHVHEFYESDQGTLMVDKIRFSAPLGPLGWLAERLVLGWYLPKLIRIRNDYLVNAQG
ncbi:SRPBCC family protein [Glutamicibacter sp. 2E12]|uniref:SRPBCC family protein n=1 Tax=unclassified Glutamicibacter TaxID=2627139 RepID=UPI0036432532